MVEQVPNDVNLLAAGLTEGLHKAQPFRTKPDPASPMLAHIMKGDTMSQELDDLQAELNEFKNRDLHGEYVRMKALELAVKVGDPDSELGLAEVLINADALCRYIGGLDRNTVGIQWRADMVNLHQQRETPLHEPDA